MPVFAYSGLDGRGKKVSGLKDADNAKALRVALKRDGIFLTDAKEATGALRRKEVGETAAAGLSGLIIAIVSHQLRDLGRTEDPIATVFYFALFGAPMAALALPFFMTSHNETQWLLLLSIGVAGTLTQFFLAASLRYGSVASVIVMDYTLLIWSSVYGWLIWDQLPTAATWMGAPLIVGAGLLIAWREHKLMRERAAAAAEAAA